VDIEIQIDLHHMEIESNRNIYIEMQSIANITKALLSEGNTDRAKRYMLLVEELFINGSTEVKNGVTNVFLFSVTSFMELSQLNIRTLLPKQLEIEYDHQINAAGV
jgi:hypothetical protein